MRWSGKWAIRTDRLLPPLLRCDQLKPVCVALLGCITLGADRASSADAIYAALTRLDAALSALVSSLPERRPLSPSLINYVFFPLAQLLRAYPSHELPDRIRHLIFASLHHLASDWWQIWTDASTTTAVGDAHWKEQWKVWEQLLILGAVALAGPPGESSGIQKAESSNETKEAVCRFLLELLLPKVAPSSWVEESPSQEWEWDGEEELPSLDDFDEQQSVEKSTEVLGDASDQGLALQIYPSSAHLQHIQQNSTCRGALAHALTASLDVASGLDSSSPIKIVCLQIARTLFGCWVAGVSAQRADPTSLCREVSMKVVKSHKEDPAAIQAERAAVFLPGYVSAMVRILNSTMVKRRADVTAQALLSLSTVLQVCLSDASVRDLAALSEADGGVAADVPRQATTIDELMLRAGVEDMSISTTTAPTRARNGEEQHTSTLTGRNRQWLESTVSHVIIALHSLDLLARDDHAQVQTSLLRLSHMLLTQCSLVLQLQRTALVQGDASSEETIDATRLLLRWTIDIAASESSTGVAITQAKASLKQVLCEQGAPQTRAVHEEMFSVVKNLPSILASQREEEIGRVAQRLILLLSLSSGGLDDCSSQWDGLRRLLRPGSGVARWGPSLLWSLRIENRNAYTLQPVLLHGLSPSTSKAVMMVFEELGRASARLLQRDCLDGKESSDPFYLLWYFVDQATTHRSTLMTSSTAVQNSRLFCQNALVVVDGMMAGIADILDDGELATRTGKGAKKLRRQAHRLARDVYRAVASLWEEDEEELLQLDQSLCRVGLSSEELSIVAEQGKGDTIEHLHGVDVQGASGYERPAGFGPALKLDFVAPATLSSRTTGQPKAKTAVQVQGEAKVQLEHTDALLLHVLGSASKILGPALKPSLLQMLYPVICGLASTSAVIRGAAATTMDEIARSAGYASVQGCVSDHADYVLGSASHRLVSTLGQELQAMSTRQSDAQVPYNPLVSAQSAPLVLVEIIRMLGGEALPLIQDAIDEVLDAIDRHHQQPGICDDLLTVLDRLLDVMVSDERSKAQERATEKLSTAASVSLDVRRDMEELREWWNRRKDCAPSEAAPRSTKADTMGDDIADDDHDETLSAKANEGPSAGQVVVVSMLNKAVPFLSHSSATIRIRCLRLLSRGIELLALQGRTVEPLQVINVAWPAIMSRLGFTLARSLRRFDRLDVPAYEDLSERDFHVCIEAAKLVTTLANHLVEYLGSEKMIRQAVPRLLLLLRIVERSAGRGDEVARGSQTTFLLKDTVDSKAISKATLSVKKWQAIQPRTPLHTMANTVLCALDTLVNAMGPHIPEDDLYRFATHPTLIQCLDVRQDGPLQRRASHFYLFTLSRRNENLVWLVLSGAVDQTGCLPAFLRHPQLHLDW